MFEVLIHLWKQSFFLPKPELTEENLSDQTGRVFIVTGGYAGVGFELCKILYAKHGSVYIAGRSNDKAQSAMAKIRQSVSSSKGKLEFLKMDLADLTTIRPAAEHFLQTENRLDVLVLNAGVMFPPAGSKSAQGYEITVATNCLGHFLLAELLTPILEKTAGQSPPGSVRIAWASSSGTDALSPKGGVTFDHMGNVAPSQTDNQLNYGISKAGNYFMASEFAKHHPIQAGGKGVVSLAFNPGNLKTELQRHSGEFLKRILNPMLHPAIYGAYTELWTGWSEDVKIEDNGRYVWPWGRMGPVRPDVQAELKRGGNAERFWNWCERETQTYL